MDRYSPLSAETTRENHDHSLSVAGDRAGAGFVQAPIIPIAHQQPMAQSQSTIPQMSRTLMASIVDGHPTNAGRFRVLFNQVGFVQPEVLVDEFVQRVLRIEKEQFLKSDPDPLEEAFSAALMGANAKFWDSFKEGTSEVRSLAARIRNWMAAAVKEKQRQRILPALKVLSLLPVTPELATQTKLLPVLRIVAKSKGNSPGIVEELSKTLCARLDIGPPQESSQQRPPAPRPVPDPIKAAPQVQKSITPAEPPRQELPPISSGSRQPHGDSTITPILPPPSQPAASTNPPDRRANIGTSTPSSQHDFAQASKAERPPQAPKPAPSRGLTKLFGGEDSIFKLSSHKRARSASPELSDAVAKKDVAPKEPVDNITPEESELPIDVPRKKRREDQPQKTVRWKSDDELVSVRYFEVDGDGFKYRSAQSARELEHAEASATKVEISEQWSTPRDLNFGDIDVPRQLQDVMGLKRGGFLKAASAEAMTQISRESGCPIVIDDPDNLPLSPAEPPEADSQPEPNAPPALEGLPLRAPKPDPPAVVPYANHTSNAVPGAMNMQFTPEQQQMWAQMSMMMPMSMPTMPMNTFYGYDAQKRPQ